MLAEGNDGKNFLEALLQHLDVTSAQVHDFGGHQELKRFLPAFARMDGFQRVKHIGIVRDAEENDAESAKQSVRDVVARVSRQGLGIGDWPTTSTFVLPDDSRPGMLETLICDSFAGTAVDTCISQFFACAWLDQCRHPSDKARAHALIATSTAPNVSVGVAAKRRIWDLDHTAFDALRQFVKSISA